MKESEVLHAQKHVNDVNEALLYIIISKKIWFATVGFIERFAQMSRDVRS